MGQKNATGIRVKTRGSGNATSKDGMNEMLVENYDTTKAAFDAMGDDMKAKYNEALGEDLANAFGESKNAIEMQLEVSEDLDDRFKQLSALLDSE